MSLGRSAINAIHRELADRAELHPGLVVAHGLGEWPGSGDQSKARLIARLASLPPAPFYLAALERWKSRTAEHARFAGFSLRLAGRLYIGVSRDNALETGVTVSHTFGAPLIPGSAVKGLARAAADALCRQGQLSEAALRWIFGTDAEEGEAGGLVFHDAWWEGASEQRPFVAEVVTPHHTEYYGHQGRAAASDFDSPVPAPQIAVQGGFYFVVEGDPDWAGVAAGILRQALTVWGIGAKKTSGYGTFRNAEA